MFTQIFSIFPQYRPYYSNIQYLATVHTYLLKYSMFYESRGCLLTYLVLDKQNPVESLLFEYSRIKVDEQKKVESVKEFYENQEERAKQNYERTSQSFVTVRKLQLLSE